MFSMNRLNKKFVNPLEVHVEFECVLSSACCFVLASEIIRYVLYQRHQIPLQVQVLQREVEKHSAVDSELQVGQREPASFDTSQSQQLKSEISNIEQEQTTKDEHKEQMITESVLCTSVSSRITSHLQQSRMKQAALRQEHLWRRYFSKVEGFVQHFQMITQALQEEVTRPGSEVRALRLALGTSYVTARELYTLHLPRMAPTSSRAAPNTRSDAAIIRALFRSFVTNEELTKLVNTSTGLKRIWIMVLKPSRQTNSVRNSLTDSTHPGQVPGKSEASTDPLMWLPRLQYKPMPMARLVNVNIAAPNWVPSPSPPPAPVSAPPTPTVGKTTRVRRLLPSLVREACDRRLGNMWSKRSRDSLGDLGMEEEYLLTELEHFELTPLKSPDHFCTLTSEKKLSKLFAPPPSRIRRGRTKSTLSSASPWGAYSSRVDDVYHSPSADVDLAHLDMVETPVATSRSAATPHLSTVTACRQDALTRPPFKATGHQFDDLDTPILDRIQKAPRHHGEQNLISANSACGNNILCPSEKLVPLSLVETTIVGPHREKCSLSETPVHQIRFITPTYDSFRFGKTSPFVSMCERYESSTDKILAPVPLIETHVVSSCGNYELKTPCTSSAYRRDESSTSKKLVSVPMIETPVASSYGIYQFKTPCTSSIYRRNESSTRKKLAPVPMVETPVVSSCVNNEFKTPCTSIYRRDEFSACKKHVPVPMIESPMVSSYGIYEFKTPCTSSMYRRDESSTCKKLAPEPMVETPICSSYGNNDFRTPCTSSIYRRNEFSTCKKLDPVPMVETPVCSSHGNDVFKTPCIPDMHRRDDSSTCKKLAPVPMVETPIVSSYAEREFTTICSSTMYGRGESSTCKKMASISMVETPVVSTYRRHKSGQLQNDTSAHGTPLGSSNSTAMTKCNLSTYNNIHSCIIPQSSPELPPPKMFELSDDSKVDGSSVPSNQVSSCGARDTLLNVRNHNVDMIQTPIATTTSNHRYNDAALDTCSGACGEAFSMVGDLPRAVVIEGDRVNPRWRANDAVHDHQRTAAAATAHERASERLRNEVATPSDRRVQQAGQRPLSAPAKTSLQVAESDHHEEDTEELVWYQLSLPLVGFKEKPVSRSITNDIDDQDYLPF